MHISGFYHCVLRVAYAYQRIFCRRRRRRDLSEPNIDQSGNTHGDRQTSVDWLLYKTTSHGTLTKTSSLIHVLKCDLPSLLFIPPSEASPARDSWAGFHWPGLDAPRDIQSSSQYVMTILTCYVLIYVCSKVVISPMFISDPQQICLNLAGRPPARTGRHKGRAASRWFNHGATVCI